MTALIQQACTLLEDDAASSALQRTAAMTLVAALEEDIVLPVRIGRLLWAWVRKHDLLHYGQLCHVDRYVDAALVKEIVSVIVLPDAGCSLKDLAVHCFLSESAASHLTDAALQALAETVVTGADATRLSTLVRARQRQRPIEQPLLRKFRDRLAGADDAAVRRPAVRLDNELQERDLGFAERMLKDPSSEVRSAVGYDYDWAARGLDLQAALAMLDVAVQSEQDADVLIALHAGRSDLLGALSKVSPV